MTLSLPSGWSSPEDSTGEFSISPNNGRDDINFWEDVYPTEGGKRVKGVPITASGLLTWLRTDPNLQTSDPVRGKIGDLPATLVDVRIAKGPKNEGPHCPAHACLLFLGFPQWDGSFGIAGKQVQRFYLADVRYGGVAHLFVAVIYPEDPSDFSHLASLGQPVIASVSVPATSS